MSTPRSPVAADNPWLAQSVRIEAITPEVAGVATYHLRFANPALQDRYRFEPGQFNMLYLPGVGEIAISVSAAGDGTLDHTVREAGNTSRALAKRSPHDSLGLRGPYGASWPLDRCRGADLIVVAGGIGLAPLRPVVHAAVKDRQRFGRVTLLYGARMPDTLLFTREYPNWRNAGVNLETTVDRAAAGWTGNVGVVPLLLDRLHPLIPGNTVLLICGPEIMMRYTVRSALARGLSKQQIWISTERNMQCAVGLCGHCQLGPKFICKHGPVFRYDDIEPYLNVEAL